jgi:hypothetical protein
MKKTFLTAAVFAAVMVAQAAQALQPGPLNFTVYRDGSEIGTHKIDIRREGADTRVDIKTDVAVKLAFITVYRFEHQGRETWREGRLVFIESKTDDDGKDKWLKGEANGKGLEIAGSAKAYTADPAIIPASLWNPKIVKQGHILNTLDGSKMAVTIKDLGEEKIKAYGKAIPARHYSVTGQLERELWFDADGTLVQVRFKGSDKSDIRYVLN